MLPDRATLVKLKRAAGGHDLVGCDIACGGMVGTPRTTPQFINLTAE